MNDGRRVGAGSTNVGQAGGVSASELFLQVLVTGCLRNLKHALFPSVKTSTDAYGETLTNHSKSQIYQSQGQRGKPNQISPAESSAAETVSNAYAIIIAPVINYVYAKRSLPQIRNGCSDPSKMSLLANSFACSS
jgi:hypothetical protein